MTTLTVQLPERVCSILREGPDELAHDMRLTAAAQWYRESCLAQRKVRQYKQNFYNPKYLGFVQNLHNVEGFQNTGQYQLGRQDQRWN